MMRRDDGLVHDPRCGTGSSMVTAAAVMDPSTPPPSEAGLHHQQGEYSTSLRIFRRFAKVVRRPDGKDELDVSDIVSRECFETWVKSRRSTPLYPERAFQRTLSAHLAGVDGRQPFTPQEEAALLKYLRERRSWPCFADAEIKFGSKGFRALGYHERLLGLGQQKKTSSRAGKTRSSARVRTWDSAESKEDHMQNNIASCSPTSDHQKRRRLNRTEESANDTDASQVLSETDGPSSVFSQPCSMPNKMQFHWSDMDFMPLERGENHGEDDRFLAFVERDILANVLFSL